MARARRADPDLNKMQAVKEVLDEQGKNAMPRDIQKAIKEKHGVEMPTSLISNYKHHLLKPKRRKQRGARRGRPPAAVAATNAAAPRGSIAFEDIETVKRLVDRMGADKVKQLAQVLAK